MKTMPCGIKVKMVDNSIGIPLILFEHRTERISQRPCVMVDLHAGVAGGGSGGEWVMDGAAASSCRSKPCASGVEWDCGTLDGGRLQPHNIGFLSGTET